MLGPQVAAAATVVTGGIWSAVAEPTGGGPDYAAIAALVTALSGLLGTGGALYLSLRKQFTLERALEELKDKKDEDVKRKRRTRKVIEEIEEATHDDDGDA